MDSSAAEWDHSAAPSLDLARISSAAVPERERAALVTDELAVRLTAGRARTLDGAAGAPSIEWLNLDLGQGLVLADVRLAALDVERTARLARSSDDDCSLFIAHTNGIRFEQNGRRARLQRGEGLFVAHSRAVRSWYTAEQMTVLRLPRAALGRHLPIEDAGGVSLSSDDEPMVLLRAYVQALLGRAASGRAPSLLARRHLAELAGAAVTARLGQDPCWSGPARAAARVESMLAFVARRHATPGLSMTDAAAAVGVSTRTGYALFEEAGIDFTEHLTALRLDRAREYLESGGPAWPLVVDVALAVGFRDLSHFNRRFRQRFGYTPREARRAAAAPTPTGRGRRSDPRR